MSFTLRTKNRKGMPIQPPVAKDFEGEIEIFPEFEEGLEGIEGFSRLMIFYQFHKSNGYSLSAKPFLDTVSHGIFASRVPKRPNAMGFSAVKLISRTGNILKIGDADILDETPVIDIKPYVPCFDSYPDERIGRFEGETDNIESARSDDRFKH